MNYSTLYALVLLLGVFFVSQANAYCDPNTGDGCGYCGGCSAGECAIACYELCPGPPDSCFPSPDCTNLVDGWCCDIAGCE